MSSLISISLSALNTEFPCKVSIFSFISRTLAIAIFIPSFSFSLTSSSNFFRSFSIIIDAFSIDPNYKEAHFNKGVTLNILGRDEEAIEEFKKVLAIDPNDKQAYAYLSKDY
ncbi:MAG: hypothetical protein GPW19_03045 [Euryarchaeota archaeon]|nr:hypothetical protein [Euryarchaeota archaeon]